MDSECWEEVLRLAGIPTDFITTYITVFDENDIKINELSHVTEEQLIRMGIQKVGHINRILNIKKEKEVAEPGKSIKDSIFTKVLEKDHKQLRKNWYTYLANSRDIQTVFTQIVDQMKIFFGDRFLEADEISDILCQFILNSETANKIENFQFQSVTECEVNVLDICLERPIFMSRKILAESKRGYSTCKTRNLGYQHIFKHNMIDSETSDGSSSSCENLLDSDEVPLQKRLKICQMALIADFGEQLDVHEANSTRLKRPATKIEILIYCDNSEVCRLLALHLALIYLDDELYNAAIKDYKSLASQNSIKFKKAKGTVHTSLTDPNAKLYDFLQTFICKQLMFGYNNIGLTSNSNIFVNLEAYVKCSMSTNVNNIFHETRIEPYCNIIVQVKDDDFLDYLSAIGNILNEISACKITIKAVYRRKLDEKHMEYYSVNIPIIGGIILTYIYFIFSTAILDLSIPITFYVSIGLCLFLTIGLAFIKTVRCIILSVLPEIFTRKARNMLISYALLLLITGPGSNILFNSRQLTETVICTREQLNAINRNLTELYLKPLRALRNSIQNLLENIKPVVRTLKSGIVAIKDAIVSLTETMKKAFAWLGTSIAICNNEIGTPFELCHKMFEKMIQDCHVKVYFPFDYLCDLGVVVEQACTVLKVIDYFCQFISFIKSDVFKFIHDKVKDLIRFIKTMFYVSISFHHSFAFETNQSQPVKKIIEKVFHAQENRLNFFLGIMSFMKFILGAYIAYVLFSTFVYRQRFFRHLYYDNYHINQFIIELDTKRASVNRQTLFPLTLGEKMRYVSLLSLRLTIHERSNFLRGSIFLIVSAVKILFLLLIDMALHWVLMLISTHGKLYFHFGNNEAIVEAEGSGLWWTIYTFINKMLKPLDLEFHFNTEPCLPTPIPPAYPIYERVAYIMAIAWLTVIFNPFGMRFRNYVMSNYYPKVARRRAVWLFNYILQMRSNISMYIRRQILRKVSFGIRTDQPSLRKWLLARFPRLSYILPYKDMYKECMVCGYTNPTVTCAIPDCPGTYCRDCFQELNSTCMICNMPHDLKTADISEEEDSEAETEQEALSSAVERPWWKFWFIASRLNNEEISLREMEDAKLECFSFQNVLRQRLKRKEFDSRSKDYFDESWRKDYWAFEEEFLIPMPDFSSWIHPRFRDEHNTQFL